ncbi:MAG TPA: SUMF1/EgtB/PvdO family nonheme iron enzyme [Fluviicola sp.]|nr:SUMF1/EgtB/PvdO family nonheme iron enzyme [Fluviicola sp.]
MDKQPILDDLFAKACQQEPVVSFNETKAQFLKGLAATPNLSAAARLRRFFTFKNSIIMFTFITVITLSVFIISPGETASKKSPSGNQPNAQKVQHKAADEPVSTDQNPGRQTTSHSTVSKPVTQVFLPGYEDGLYANLPVLPLVNKPLPETDNFSLPTKKEDEPDEYIFPKLTEEQIAANNKQKKSMLKALSRFDKKSYAYIPTGTFEYGGKQVSLQSFYMQTTEVTNLEYRTFLFDLLIQGRKDDFLIAKPDQAQWAALYGEGMKPYEEHYFSHEAYNKYPVVNVSREGAELYCKWLTEECNKANAKKGQAPINDVRIPTRTEWVYAATAEGEQQPYPWKGQEVRNSEGCYLANFKPEPGNFMIDGAFCTAKVTSYEPSESGLFCLSGNVSEMVYNSNTDRSNPGTAGGNWTSTAEEIKLLADDPNAGVTDGKPTIGFRVVVTSLVR